MRRAARWAAALAALALVAALAAFVRVRAVALDVQADGAERARIADWLRTHALGRPLARAHPFRLRAALARAFPELADVRVRWLLPGRVVVAARARRPLALAHADGRWWFVDRDGAWPGRAQADLPVLRAPRARWPEGAAVLAVLSRRAPARWRALSELRFVLGWRLVFAKGELWLVGAASPARRTRQVLDWLGSKGVRAPVRLDASMQGRWFVRPARVVEVEG